MKISLNDEWQDLVEDHEREDQLRKQANARQNLLLLCALVLLFLAALAAIGFVIHII